jgi:hypothetical protein
VHRKYIPIYIQQDAKLHSLFIPGNCSTCFGWYFHPSSGAPTTVSTASGSCHTVTAICRDRGRVGTGLSVLCVAYSCPRTVRRWQEFWALSCPYGLRNWLFWSQSITECDVSEIYYIQFNYYIIRGYLPVER